MPSLKRRIRLASGILLLAGASVVKIGCSPATAETAVSEAKHRAVSHSLRASEVGELRMAAKAAIRSQNYTLAEEKLLAARDLQPNSHQRRKELADLYERWNRPAKAYAELKVIALAPLPGDPSAKSISSMQSEAWLYLKCAGYAATHGSPGEEMLILNRGWAMAKKKFGGFPEIPTPLPGSRASYQQSLLLSQAMQASIQQGDNVSIPIFLEAVELDRSSSAAWYALAISVRATGDDAKARKYLKEALRASRRSVGLTAQIKDSLADLDPRGIYN